MNRLKGFRTILVMAAAAIPPLLDVVLPILMMPEWQGVMPREWWPIYSLIIAAAGVLLRSVTTTPVGRRE